MLTLLLILNTDIYTIASASISINNITDISTNTNIIVYTVTFSDTDN